MPAGLVSGSVLAVATAALLRRPTRVPLWLARICFVLIGMLLGAVVTPETLAGITTWPLSVALLMVSTICTMVVTTFYLRLAHGWDPLSALLGASPGAMAQVVALAAEFGADMRGVAIVQTMRVLVVTIGLPGGLALFGFAAAGVIVVPGPASGSSLVELALIAVGVLADGIRHGAAALSRRPAVRRHGGLRGAARHRLRACGAALVGRQQRGHHARRGGGIAVRQCHPSDAAGLCRGGARLVRGRDRGRLDASCWW